MKRSVRVIKHLLAPVGALLLLFTLGCGSQNPILGGGVGPAAPPTVTAVVPVDQATGVSINTTVLTAAFSEQVSLLPGSASFTVTGAAVGSNPVGTVALDATSRTATFTLAPATTLAPLNVYTATVTGAKSLSTGLSMSVPYVWTFTTGATPDTTRPRVTLTGPITSIPGPTTGVSINTAIVAAFTEDMSPATLTAASFTLTGPGTTVVAGSVSYASRTAVFVPTALLASSTTYTATVTTAATDLAGNALAGNQAALPAASNYVWTFTTSAALDTTRPQVTLTVPATTVPGPTTGVATNTAIAVAFTEDMAPATLTTSSFTLAGPGVTAVVGSVTYASRTAVFTPQVALASSTTYTATLTTAATDLAGNTLAGNQAAFPAASSYIWTFTTAAGPDTTRPQVTLTVPATTIPGPTTGVATNTSVAAAFTEDMAPLTLNALSFTLTGPGATAVAGGVSYASRTAVFTPAAVLATNTTYTATITTAATDLAGNTLAGNQAALPAASNYVWTFTTAAAPDTTRPRVTLTVPATTILGPTTGTATNVAISAAFTEAMAPATLTTASFTLTGPGATVVAGSVAYASQTATFTPTAALLSTTTYTATITTVATDLAGNQLAGNQAPLPAASNYVWTFTTAAAPDTTRPMVTLTVPATTLPGPTTGIATNVAISAAFTEAMAPATLTTASFTLTGPGATVVAGSVAYISQIATFTPTAILASNTTYTATITTLATDLAGNQLAGNQAALPAASNYVWTFTTAAAPDTTRPMVTLTVPVTTIPGPTTGVAINTAITAAFTEPMNATTLTAASFTVTGPGLTVVNGLVSYTAASQTALFVPSAPLLAGTTYTATITILATDLAGNALAGNQAPLPAASNYVWTFTTSVALDTTPPTIILTKPVNLATAVTINTAVNATFSEAMDLSGATFTLQLTGGPLGPILPGAFSYDPISKIATFTPSSALLALTSYTATVSGAKDLAGNALAPGLVPNPWSFTTGSALAPGAVPLGSAGAFGIMATSAITNTGIATMVNGDVSLEPGTSCGLLPAQVNGSIHINDSVSHLAKADLLAAYNFAKTLPPGTTITGGADLGALPNMPPGTYTSASTMLISTPLTLNGGGDTNAVWVFQIGSSLTTGASVILTNGAQAKNVFWVSTVDVTVGVGTTFNGTIITGRDATGVTGATINGRILAGAITAGTIALDSNTVNVPAP